MPRVRAALAGLLTAPAVAVALAACSGTAASTPAARTRNLPVYFTVSFANGSFYYNGIRPTSIDLTTDGEPLASNVAVGLTWSRWPSGPRGIVPASATAAGSGKIQGTLEAVTITLSSPSNGKPSFWQTLTEQIQGQTPVVYHFAYPGPWPIHASGGEQLP